MGWTGTLDDKPRWESKAHTSKAIVLGAIWLRAGITSTITWMHERTRRERMALLVKKGTQTPDQGLTWWSFNI